MLERLKLDPQTQNATYVYILYFVYIFSPFKLCGSVSHFSSSSSNYLVIISLEWLMKQLIKTIEQIALCLHYVDNFEVNEEYIGVFIALILHQLTPFLLP